MRRLFLFCILHAAFCIRSFAAAGDPLGAYVATNGWDIFITFSGMNSNGTYQLGLAPLPGLTQSGAATPTNSVLASTNKLRLTWDTPGYLNGTLITQQLSAVGTVPVTKPTTGTTHHDESVAGGNTIVRFALSDYVCSGDTNLSLTLLAAAYSQGGTDSAAGTLTVTNNSVLPHKGAVVNHTRPGWKRWTNAVELVGAYGANDLPLDCVEFILTTTNIAITNRVLAPEIDYGRATRGFYRPEYLCRVTNNGSLFTNLAECRVDIVGYPKRGDTNAVLDTRRNLYAQPTTKPAAITNLVDWNRAYTDLICVVANGGSDANGRPTNCAPSDVNSAHYFATFAGALSMAAGTNNLRYSHNDIGGVVVYGRNSVSNWMGGTLTVTTVPKARAIIRPYPGETLIIDPQTGDRDAADRVEFIGVEFRGEQNLFSGTDHLQFTDCVISNAHFAALAQNCAVIWAENCRLERTPEGIQGYSTQNTAWMLWGCDLTHFNANFAPRFAMGCYVPGMRTGLLINPDYTSSGTPPNLDYLIYEGCYFGGLIRAASVLDLGANLGVSKGVLLENCVFEAATNNISTVFSIFASGANAATNVVIKNCVFAGKRALVFYNDTGTSPVWRVQNSILNCVFDNTGWKSWDFNGGTNVNRIGNLSIQYGVGCFGNVYVECETTGSEAAGSFTPYFPGIGSYHPLGSPISSGTNTTTWPRYTSRKSQGGTTDPPPGGGDYRLLSDSPLFRVPTATAGFFDLHTGYRARVGGFDPPGAEATGNVRKGF